jgi:PhzF family phenazine biosynthesis protein
VEVDLCGHATLASAHVLWEEGRAPREEEVTFHTKSGILRAAFRGGAIELDFPATPAREMEAPPGLAEALGAETRWVGRNEADYLVELADEAAVRGVRPDFRKLQAARGVMVTARSESPGIDFVSRFFAPAAGVDEDPVTGSAHCTLGPFWAARLGRRELTGYQASARGGTVRVVVGEERVTLRGTAITMLRAELVGA